jgi:hypothetical protein
LIDVQSGDRVVFVERAPFHFSFHPVFLHFDAFPSVDGHGDEKNYDFACRDSALSALSLREAFDCLSVPQVLASSALLLP